MKHKRSHKEIGQDIQSHYSGLAKQIPDKRASERFKRPAAYQAGTLLREQGIQIEHKSVEQYLAEKYDIRGGEASGQDSPD